MSFRDLGIIEVTVFAVLVAAFLLFFILFVILRRRKQAANNRKLLKQRALMEEAVQKKVRRAGEKNSRITVESDAVMRPEEYEMFAPDRSRMRDNSVSQQSSRMQETSRQPYGRIPEKRMLGQNITEYQNAYQDDFHSPEDERMRETDRKRTQVHARTREGMRNLLQNALESETAQESAQSRVRKIVRGEDGAEFSGRRYEPQEEFAEEFSGRKYESRREYEEEFSEENLAMQEEYKENLAGRNRDSKEEYREEFSEKNHNSQRGYREELSGKNLDLQKGYRDREFYSQNLEIQDAQWDIPDDADFSGHSLHSLQNAHSTNAAQEYPSGRKSAQKEETFRLWDNNSKSLRMAKRSQQDPPFFVEERRISHRRDQLKRLEEAK